MLLCMIDCIFVLKNNLYHSIGWFHFIIISCKFCVWEKYCIVSSTSYLSHKIVYISIIVVWMRHISLKWNSTHYSTCLLLLLTNVISIYYHWSLLLLVFIVSFITINITVVEKTIIKLDYFLIFIIILLSYFLLVLFIHHLRIFY